MAAVDDTYEFRKTAKHEIKYKTWLGQWDEFGRYFMLQGRKSSTFDKQLKSIRFFNMFGELLDIHEDIQGLDYVRFRSRAKEILKPDKVKKLKKNYKTIYEQMFKDEQNAEKKVQNDIVKDKRKQIRDDFLNNFFIPLRQ